MTGIILMGRGQLKKLMNNLQSNTGRRYIFNIMKVERYLDDLVRGYDGQAVPPKDRILSALDEVYDEISEGGNGN